MNDDAYDRMPLRAVPDLRGLLVEDASGLSVGELWGALAEADTGLIRYLDLQLSRRPRHVLVPIGHARIRDVPATRVRLRAALLEELESIPAFESDVAEISDPYERALLEAHGRAYHGERYYAHPSFDHGGLFAGEHPIVTAGGKVAASAPLQLLGTLADYRVAAGEPDIRGWPVRGAGDVTLGVVHDLVVDTAGGKVRYLVVDGDHGTARQVVLPVGYIHLDAPGHVVTAPALSDADLAALPGWTGGALERTDEEAVRAALLARLTGRRRYHAPDFALPERGFSAVEQRGA